MKLIQYFRGVDTKNAKSQAPYQSYANGSVLLSMILTYLDARQHYNDIELYTDELGAEQISNLPIFEYRKISYLPQQENITSCDRNKAIDCFFIANDQVSSFLILTEGTFLLKEIPAEKTDFPIVAYTRSMNPAIDYYHRTSINIAIKDESVFNDEHSQIKNSGFDLTIFGGSDCFFWKRYYAYISAKINDVKRFGSLPNPTYRYLLHSYLLQCFLDTEKKTLSFIEDRPFRIAYLKSATDLLNIHRNVNTVIIPEALFNHSELYQFILESLRTRHSEHLPEILGFLEKTKESPAFVDNNSVVVSPFFELTTYFLKTVLKKETKFTHLSIIEETVESCLKYLATTDPSAIVLLKDVLYYEKTKYTFHQITGKRSSEQNGTIPNYSKFKQMQAATVQLSTLASIVTTKWDWRVGLNLKELVELKIKANMTTPASEFTTLFFYDDFTSSVRCYSMDKLNCNIINMLSTPTQIQDIICSIMECFDCDKKPVDTNSISETLFLRIYDLLLLKAVVFVTPVN